MMFRQLRARFAAGKCAKLATIVLALLIFTAQTVFGAVRADGRDITVTADIQWEEEFSAAWLARIVTKQDDANALAFGLRWQEDSAGWFPVWSLQLVGAPDLLSKGEVVSTGLGSEMRVLKLDRFSPIPKHKYEITMSYASAQGALALKILDATDNKVVYTHGLQVSTFRGDLYGLGGTVSNKYLPVGVTWNIGTAEPGGTFTDSTYFTRRNEHAAVRINDPAPAASSAEYRVVLGNNGKQKEIARTASGANEQLIPLSLVDFPLGVSTLHLDYLQGGEVLTQLIQEVTLGSLTLALEPVVVNRGRGVLEAAVNIASAEPFNDAVAAQLSVSIDELVWDSKKRVFNEVPFQSGNVVYKGKVDFSTGGSTLPIQLPLPNRPGNWKIRVVPEVQPQMRVQVGVDSRIFSTYAPAEIGKDEPYTIVVFPDTQFFAKSYPSIFIRMTDWVAANAAERNIAAVLHVGDITGGNSPDQWERAYTSMSLLHGVVPYVLTLGNHDMNVHVSSRTGSLVNNYFSVEQAKMHSNLIGTFQPGLINNSYSVISAGETNYLVIALDYGPSNESVEWANQVAAQYPKHRMILLTHSYTTKTGSLAEGMLEHPIAIMPGHSVNTATQMWQKLMSKNANSFMVVSGHTSPPLTIPYRIGKADPGQAVYELLVDLQAQDNGGNGWLGLITFKPDNTIEVSLYSPYLGESANAMDGSGFTSQFVIDLPTATVKKVNR